MNWGARPTDRSSSSTRSTPRIRPVIGTPATTRIRSRALGSLGFAEVKDVRLGKIIELEIDSTDAAEAKKRVEQMCEKLLANTVIEEYRVEEIR